MKKYYEVPGGNIAKALEYIDGYTMDNVVWMWVADLTSTRYDWSTISDDEFWAFENREDAVKAARKWFKEKDGDYYIHAGVLYIPGVIVPDNANNLDWDVSGTADLPDGRKFMYDLGDEIECIEFQNSGIDGEMEMY